MEQDAVILKSNFLTKRNLGIGELLYLVMFAIYIFCNVVNATMLLGLWSQLGRVLYLLSEFTIVGITTKILFFDDWNVKDKTIIILLGIIFWQICINSGEFLFFYYYIFIVGAQNVDLKKIMVLFLRIVIAIMVISAILSLLGIITNIKVSRQGEDTIRYSMGAIYPTDFAARSFYVLLVYATLKKFKFKLVDFIGSIAFTSLVFIMTDTRLDLLLMILTILLVLLNKRVNNIMSIVNYKIVSYIVAFFIFLNILLAYLYTPSKLIFQIANKILSGRLVYGHLTFEKYNTTIFGQYIYQMGGGGIHNQPFYYFYIDVSFIRLLMMEGLLAFLALIVFMYFLNRRYSRAYANPLILAMLMVIISSAVDQHLFELSFNIVFLGLFANISYWKSIGK